MYPDIPIIPIVIFADPKRWRKDVKREIKLEMFGRVYLHFSFRKVKLKDLEAPAVQDSDNPVLHILTPLMHYPDSERYHFAVSAYINLRRYLGNQLFYNQWLSGGIFAILVVTFATMLVIMTYCSQIASQAAAWLHHDLGMSRRSRYERIKENQVEGSGG